LTVSVLLQGKDAWVVKNKDKQISTLQKWNFWDQSGDVPERTGWNM